jgi:hypothetical protein
MKSGFGAAIIARNTIICRELRPPTSLEKRVYCYQRRDPRSKNDPSLVSQACSAWKNGYPAWSDHAGKTIYPPKKPIRAPGSRIPRSKYDALHAA